MNIPENRRNLFKEKLSELIFNLIWYYNRLRLEESLINYEYTPNQKILKTKRYNPLNMLIHNTDEPGMTKEDISGFNTKRTEDYADFIDRFSEFFDIYGIILYLYDTGNVYIVVQHTEKYLQLLKELQKIQDKNAKYLVRAVDIGIIESKKFTYEHVLTGEIYQIKMVDNKEKKYFKHIPEILDLHNQFDPNPPEENFYLRKRILGYHNALEKGYLVDRMSLESYLPFEEVGKISKSNYLSTEIIDHDFLVGWKNTLTVLKTVIWFRGGSSKEIIRQVMESLDLYMKEQYKTGKEKQPKKKAVLDFYSEKLKQIKNMKLVDAPENSTTEIKPDPYDQLMIDISYVDESEYEKIKKFVSKLKRKPFPF